MIKPITPDEVRTKRLDTISPEVIQAINELLVTYLKNGTAIIEVKEIMAHALTIDPKTSINLDACFPNIKTLFESAGWTVDCDFTFKYDNVYVFTEHIPNFPRSYRKIC